MHVRQTAWITPRLVRLTFGGDLDGFPMPEPAASVRLLVPVPPDAALAIPEWNGNEFLLPDGRRPAIRTFTPRHLRTDPPELDIDVVVHGDGPASTWAAQAVPEAVAAISGPGRGYSVDTTASRFVLAGDDTAVPAISQLLEALPGDADVDVHIELAEPAARPDLPEHPRLTARWYEWSPGEPPGAALADALRDVTLADTDRLWAAGEAAAVQRVRRHFFQDAGLPRAHASIRGYWKHGRAGGGDE